ncbi:MAG: hypothetical protein CVU11_09630 [Bacteroidetes bacterium HGW-Bacteroidetes-6]|jgi:hypothetical protein|nr:MAG: hypothetical protein CVU11_09630 [Bacteroidetes bacterium HGW-Bacteroidetes-6]
MKTWILKIKYRILSLLTAVSGMHYFRDRKLVAGTLLLFSLGSLLSCNQHKRTTCYVVPISGDDTIKTLCYEVVVDTVIQTPPEKDTSDQIMCYKSVVPRD